jgi:hypothetical protein
VVPISLKFSVSAVRGLELTAADQALFNLNWVRAALSGDPGVVSKHLDP